VTEIGAEQSSIVVFPMPIDVMEAFLDLLKRRIDRSPRANEVDKTQISVVPDRPLT
jgi:hypothetical protein